MSLAAQDAVVDLREGLMATSKSNSVKRKAASNSRASLSFKKTPTPPKDSDTFSTSRRPAKSVSKQETVLSMLRHANGTTIAAIMKATGWQQHSVRGFFAGVVKRRLQLKLSSEKVREQRLYKIAKAGSAS